MRKKPAHDRNPDCSAEFERALQNSNDASHRYILRLYVTGSTYQSSNAIQNIIAVCDEHLAGRYELEVIDIHQQPTAASAEQIIAAPTLYKKLPAPARKLIGDLSSAHRIAIGLGLHSQDAGSEPALT